MTKYLCKRALSKENGLISFQRIDDCVREAKKSGMFAYTAERRETPEAVQVNEV
jgi:hypothetical protein